MKKCLLIITALLLTLGLIGCTRAISPRPPRTVNITTTVGEEFVIALGSNPSTGYRWKASYDEERIELLEQTYKPKESADVKVVGGEGVEYFKFKALKPGKTEITMTCERSWEIGYIDQIIYVVEVK